MDILLEHFDSFCHLPEGGNLWLLQSAIRFLSRECSEWPEFINLISRTVT